MQEKCAVSVAAGLTVAAAACGYVAKSRSCLISARNRLTVNPST